MSRELAKRAPPQACRQSYLYPGSNGLPRLSPQYPEAEVLVSSDGRGTEDPTEDLQSKISFYDVANIGIIFVRPGAAAKEFAEVRRGARGARVGGGILKGMIAW